MLIRTPQDKIRHELGTLYDAEQTFLASAQRQLPQVADAKLQEHLRKNIVQARNQLARLEVIFEDLEQRIEEIPCAAAQGIAAESEAITVPTSDNAPLYDCVVALGQLKSHHLKKPVIAVW